MTVQIPAKDRGLLEEFVKMLHRQIKSILTNKGDGDPRVFRPLARVNLKELKDLAAGLTMALAFEFFPVTLSIEDIKLIQEVQSEQEYFDAQPKPNWPFLKPLTS